MADLAAWFAANADAVWGENKPSLSEAKNHSRSVRPTQKVGGQQMDAWALHAALQRGNSTVARSRGAGTNTPSHIHAPAVQLAQYFRDYRVRKKAGTPSRRASTPSPGPCEGATPASRCQPSGPPSKWAADDASSSSMPWAGQDEGFPPARSSDPGLVDWSSSPAFNPLAAPSMALHLTRPTVLLHTIGQRPSTTAAGPLGATSSLPLTFGAMGFEHIEAPDPGLHSGSHSTGQSPLPHLMGTPGRLDHSWAFEPLPLGPEALRLPPAAPPSEQQLQPLYGMPQAGIEGRNCSQWTLPLSTSSNPPLPGNFQTSMPADQGTHEDLMTVVQQQQAMMEAMQQQLQALQQRVMQQRLHQQPGLAVSRPSASSQCPVQEGPGAFADAELNARLFEEDFC
jgi:hypothetical protein